MKKIFSLIFLTMFFFASIANAEIETYTGKGEATMGESETLEKVIERAKQYAKREAVEKAGVYIKSHSKTENFKLIEDEIISLAGGIVKVIDSDKEIISKDNAVKVFVTVTITIDTDDLQREIDKYFEKNTQKTKIEVVQEKIEKKSPEIYNIALAKQKTNEAFKLCENKKFDYALKVADEAINLNPNNAESYDARGWANMELKNYTQSISDYTKAIQLNPDNAVFYNARGSAYIWSGNFIEAYSDINKAIQLEPNNANYHDCLGWCYNCIGEHDKAISECNKALKLDPNHSWAYHTRGEAYRLLRKYKLAIPEYDKSISIKSDWAPVYFHRGECYKALGENSKAEKDFTKARQLG